MSQQQKPQPYAGEERRHKARGGVVFDNTINLGHVLTFLGFVITIMVTWSTLDKRVVVLEESRKAQEVRDATQDARNGDQLTAIKDSLTEIKNNVVSLRDKLDRRSQ